MEQTDLISERIEQSLFVAGFELFDGIKVLQGTPHGDTAGPRLLLVGKMLIGGGEGVAVESEFVSEAELVDDI